MGELRLPLQAGRRIGNVDAAAGEIVTIGFVLANDSHLFMLWNSSNWGCVITP